jgi:predicted nucleic acid-binding protein
MYLLDTSTCIEAIRGGASVRERIVVAARDCAVSVMTVAELRWGASLSRQPATERERVDALLFPWPVLDFSSRCVDPFLKIRSDLRKLGTMINDMDMMIAATALAEGRIVVTVDRDFRRIPGLRVEDWTR